jgi:hypothetical protein
MHIRTLAPALLGAALAAGAVVACSATGGTNGFTQTGGTGGNGSSGNGGEGGLDIGAGVGGGILGQAPPCNGKDPNKDNDGDGWSGAQGDCNDCTDQISPGAQDYPGNNIDEDCDGGADDNPTNCDGNIDVASNDPIAAAQAMGICKMQKNNGWGLISASYVTSDGQPLHDFQFDPEGLGHGVLTSFGPKVHPQEGHRLLALSSGTGRQPNDPGYQSVGGYDKGYSNSAPPGYPKESPSCPGTITGEPHDSAGLLVKIRAPTNAKSLKFNLNFYTYEFPNFVCSTFNDFFVAILDPHPQNQPDGNISFDQEGNLISVNAGFLQVCTPQMAGGKNFSCPLGPEQLMGTGYDEDGFGGSGGTNSAATGWLQTTSPITPGTDVQLLFAIWDSGDGVLDSTVLLDNFAFDVTGADTATTPIGVPK